MVTYSPIVVKVAQFVDQSLKVNQWPADVVLQNIIGSGRNRALSGRLGHQEKLGNVGIADGVVHHGARHWIGEDLVY